MAVPPLHHLLIPFAGRGSPGCRAALAGLRLPNLETLLGLLTAAETDTQDDTTLSPPHERAQARAIGIAAPDGCIPWAALEAHRSGLAAPGTRDAWAHVTLCNWQVGIDDAVLGDPADLVIEAAESAALLAVARPFFEEDGIALHPTDHSGRWLARAKIFESLPTTSIDRAVGCPVSQWSPLNDATRALRRLQNEMQMLLYNERVNDERTTYGVPAINSLWFNGTGALPADFDPLQADTVESTVALRGTALRDDGMEWAAAWQALDAEAVASLLAKLKQGRQVKLTLCGDRGAVTYSADPAGGLSRWARNLFQGPRAIRALDPL